MEDKLVNFEYYVLNEDINKREIGPFNIFRNHAVLVHSNKLCKRYKDEHMSFEDFTEELRSIIMWQEWSRCEYEIMVSPLIQRPGDEKYFKIDCYQQALPNIKIIAKYVLDTYYNSRKSKKPRRRTNANNRYIHRRAIDKYSN